MAHYGQGRFAHNKVAKDPNTAYTKAPLYKSVGVTLADGTSVTVTINKGKGVDIARAFGLPFAPIMTPKGLEQQLAALSAYKAAKEEVRNAVWENGVANKAYLDAQDAVDAAAAALVQASGDEAVKLEAELASLKAKADAAAENARKTQEASMGPIGREIEARIAYNGAAALFGVSPIPSPVGKTETKEVA